MSTCPMSVQHMTYLHIGMTAFVRSWNRRALSHDRAGQQLRRRACLHICSAHIQTAVNAHVARHNRPTDVLACAEWLYSVAALSDNAR